MRARRLAALALAALVVIAAAVGLDRAFPPDLSRAALISPELDDAAGQVLALRPAADGAIRLAPGATGPDLVPLLLAREDRRFAAHPGIDPLALLRAAGQLAADGRVVSGGSTLAMQVARLLEPHPRTLAGKLHDMVRALQLEARLGRAGVLRLWLTLAPMGGNIEGVRAASLLYFGREPADLTRAQAALLVALPQSPARRRPDRHPAAAWRAAERVLAASGGTASLAGAPLARASLPALARHLAGRYPGRVSTTLDGALQAQVEALAARELPWLGPEADVAAVVLRNRDRAVLAYLGGARFFGPAGMVDMVRARRSPGSTLKPFVYAMAFDAGLATPATWLDDDRLRLGTWTPQDFDHAEHGTVTAAEALRRSLNRPAVRLLAAVGPERFAAALRAAGATLVLPRGGTPSAALALGGEGISLLDVAALYADLADGGKVGMPRLIREVPAAPSPGAPPARLISRDSAAQVAAILRAMPPPRGMAADPVHPVAWKSGTSYGFRDAWACGFTPAYTVVVWVGRRDGTPRPGATGGSAAAPLLFRLFDLLPPEPPIQDAALPPPAPLAPALRHMAAGQRLRILFPPSQVEIAYDPAAPIDLRAAGGTPPYAWTADGIPLPSASQPASTAWTAPGPGFAHLTVTDRDGNSASADVRLVGD